MEGMACINAWVEPSSYCGLAVKDMWEKGNLERRNPTPGLMKEISFYLEAIGMTTTECPT